VRKKFIPLSLALCLTLSGCGGNVVLERSYSVSTPHSEVYWENEGADTLRADSYQDLVNALLLLLGEHSEEGVVRIYSEEDAAAMAEQACKEVQEETALGAYLLDYISYTDTQERAYYEMHVRLGYRPAPHPQQGGAAFHPLQQKGILPCLTSAGLRQGRRLGLSRSMTQLLAAHTTNEGHGADVTLHQCGEPLARTVLPLTAFIAGTRTK